MKQYFAAFMHRPADKERVADILCFDSVSEEVTQFNTRCGIQSIPDAKSVRLTQAGSLEITTTTDPIEQATRCPYKPMDIAIGDKLTSQFSNLQTGLMNNSEKTIAWLKAKGFEFVVVR